MTEQFANFAQSTLSSPINAIQNNITVSNASTFPLLGNFRIVVQSFDSTTNLPTSQPEIMLVTSVAGNVFTVIRSVESSTNFPAIAFASGAQVTHICTAAVMTALSSGGLLSIGSLIGGGIAGSSLYIDANGLLAQDNPNYNYIPSTGVLNVTSPNGGYIQANGFAVGAAGLAELQLNAGFLGAFAQTFAGVGQIAYVNQSANATASVNLVLGNNLDTNGTTNYINLGMNSSAFTGTGSLNIANAGYLYSQTGDLVIGTGTSNAIHFIINNGSTDSLCVTTSGFLGIASSIANTTSLVTIEVDTIGAVVPTAAQGAILQNTTPAAFNAQQFTPALSFSSFGWGTTASTSQPIVWKQYASTTQGLVPSGTLIFAASLSGGAYTNLATLSTSGVFTTTALVTNNTNQNIYIPTGAGITHVTTAQFQYAGSTGNGIRISFYGSTSSILTANDNYSQVIFSGAPVTGAVSGTHTWLSQVVFNGIGTYTAGVAAVTNSTVAYFAAAGVIGTNNYSIYSAGGTVAINGNFVLNTAGNGIQIKAGSNARIGTGTLSGGTLAVANTSVTANTRVFLTDTSGSTTNVGSLTVVTSAGVGFTVTSTIAIDTSTFNWLLIEQN